MDAGRWLPDLDLDLDDVRDSRGRRVTQEYVDAAVVAGLAAVSRGRPSLTGERAASPQVTFRLTPELRACADAEAARQGRRLSDVAREALEQYLAP